MMRVRRGGGLRRTGVAGCARPPRERGAANAAYAFVVLGEEGRAVARAITPAPDCPAIELDGVAAPMDSARASGDDPAAADAERAVGIEAVDVSGARLREGDSRRRRARGDRRPDASAAEGESATDRRDRRHRLPDQDRGSRRSRRATIRASGRSRAVADAAAEAASRSRHPRRRLSLSRERVSRGQRRMRRQPVGLRLGRVGSRSVRAGAKAPRGRAVDRRARQPRVVQSRGPGLVALPRSAPAGAAAGLQRARRRCDRRLQRAVRGAARIGRATPIRSSSCSIRRSSASRRCRRAIRCTSSYRAQFERAFALAARRPNTFFMNHHPVLAFAPNPAKPDAPYPRQRRAAIGAADAAADRAVPART